MGYKQLSIGGLNVTFRNIPGSAITRVSINNEDAFGFDPGTATFIEFVNGKRTEIIPDLTVHQVSALHRALVEHSQRRLDAYSRSGKLLDRVPTKVDRQHLH